ncbi:MAG: ribonuclease G [Methylobacter tundripaludum]|uniref:Ribonuclease G n=1 Tax=Methylobacter tundripaludum TaxID=173365 RepID=A0A2S6HKD4_9GAMM|nr:MULTISPECIES: ribonuclease G [Methylobacter]MDD4904727.1 ribonuclease G [Methylobacter tundripaludum]MDI1276284.1 ribonuclease G [Methylobacter sp.]MDI1357004.1 ribonuclease G [Methylobacter sp.]PPK77843.1 RNAse G [Methylobacter tundripaludum]
MSEEILINVTPPETRVAVIENGVLQELIIERTRQRGLVGNIYKGEVCRVLPGMQAAFVDIGLPRAAFLHLSDLCAKDLEKKASENIEHYLHEGQHIIVQVVKDPLGSKGARLTTEISIPSRFQVYMPYAHNSGVSQRIECETERVRLRTCLDTFRLENKCGGFIARTAAECVDETVLIADMTFLLKLWESIAAKIAGAKPKQFIHKDLPLSIRTLRDLYREGIERVRVDSRETYHRLVEFAEIFAPEIVPVIEHYTGECPVFDIYSVEDEIQKALERKVNLKSGGHLVFDQTESMTTVDVNTGGYVGGRNLEETIFKTNLEAAQTISRQLRLRNLGGIIIIDFIDMQSEDHKKQVLQAFERHLEKDHAKTNITEVSVLGLVEMTRKRTRESLEHILCEPCSACGGRGVLKTAESMCLEIFREIIREVRQYKVKKILVLASNEVVEMLLDEEADMLAELEVFLGVRIKFRAEAEYNQEQYDVVLL